MGLEEEPAYKRFDYICKGCGRPFHEYGSTKRCPDKQYCPDCEKEENIVS